MPPVCRRPNNPGSVACGLQQMIAKTSDSVKRVPIPMLIYGSESWVWQEKNGIRINAVGMRSLCNVCGVSLKGRCRNSDVGERCGLKEDVVARIEKRILRWLGHVERINESRLTKQIYISSVRWKVRQGPP
ncbi:hypothetical protein EVAR_6404_1 [Eumeta japonica]|uniref:Uncharacterized protein n=1 Tax=Eumeta variegata TaxID=151549 RepID=A0A4C1TCN5_EUMVA|nr:hypothetical protein EVAR_6404_1 [Eumeta japonica]